MFFARYEKLCKNAKKSTTGVALELGVAKSTVSYWRANRNVIPKQDVLLKIAEYFNVSIDYLLGNEAKERPFKKTNTAHAYLRQDIKTPYDNMGEPFVATNREIEIITEYRNKPEIQQQINKILNKKSSNAVNNDEALILALWDSDTKDITPQMLDKVREFARFILEEERRKNNGPDKPV